MPHVLDKKHWVGLRRPDFTQRFWQRRKEYLSGVSFEQYKMRLNICWDEWDFLVGRRCENPPILKKRYASYGEGKTAVFERFGEGEENYD